VRSRCARRMARSRFARRAAARARPAARRCKRARRAAPFACPCALVPGAAAFARPGGLAAAAGAFACPGGTPRAPTPRPACPGGLHPCFACPGGMCACEGAWLFAAPGLSIGAAAGAGDFFACPGGTPPGGVAPAPTGATVIIAHAIRAAPVPRSLHCTACARRRAWPHIGAIRFSLVRRPSPSRPLATGRTIELP
jgi:hypothetical protein